VIVIHASALAAIVAHAREAIPLECCGLLIGDANAVVESVASPNLSGDPNRYLIDPAVHIAALRRARTGWPTVAGFYHSHPRSPADPSQTDIAEASYPDLLYLIVGLGPEPPDVRLFRLADGNFHRVEFVTGT